MAQDTKRFVVAIDGPAGAGKSTVAQIVAAKLNYTYIDTGAMYRAVAYKALKAGEVTDRAIEDAANSIEIVLRYREGKSVVFADGEDVTEAIRTPEVTGIVSRVAALSAVRSRLLLLQRAMAEGGGVVMDGRDICAHVLPKADVKLFLTATIEERARRRWKELKEKGYEVDLAELRNQIAARDKMDSERELSPLIKAEDARLLDTTNLSIDEAAEAILKLCR